MATNPESLASAGKAKSYSSFGSDIDLVAEGGAPCRLIRVQSKGSGSLVVTMANGEEVAFGNCADNELLPIQAAKIKSTTNLAAVNVLW